MIVVQTWNDMRKVCPHEFSNKKPETFRVIAFNIDPGNWESIKDCWETTNFDIQSHGLILGHIPQELATKTIAYCVVSDCCSTDYAKKYLQSVNWSKMPPHLDPEYFQ